MKPLRLVLVTRRFWPLIGGAQTLVGSLAAGLVARGAQATIVTGRWQSAWPERIEHRGVPVIRLAHPGPDGWGPARWTFALWRWLRSHRRKFDLVYVAGLKHEAYAAIRATRLAGRPVALCATGSGLSGDCHWQLDARCGARIKRATFHAEAILAPTSSIERELIAAGYPRQRIHHLPAGVPLPPPRSAAGRLAARETLAGTHPALGVEPNAPVALFTGRLDESKGLDSLLIAWEEFLGRRPAAKLWLVGEGPLHDHLAGRIKQRGMAASVVLAGAFDQIDEFLSAADLFVYPAVEEGTNLALLEAMAAGLPIVASNIPGHRDLIRHRQNGFLAPVGDPSALFASMEMMLIDPPQASSLAEAARERVAAEYSLDRMVQSHVEMFERLVYAGEAVKSEAS